MSKFWNRSRAPRDPGHRRRVWALVRPHRAQVATLSIMSFLGGAVEAAFLVVVTRVALSVADGKKSTGLLAGRTVSIGSAIWAAAGLLVVRLVLALFAVSSATSLSIDAETILRRRLADAYLNASWATQQAEPTGQLQQLVTGFSSSAGQVVSSFTGTIAASLNLAALIAVALLVDPIATLVVVGALAVLGSILGPIRRRIRLRSRESAVAQMEFANSVSELGALGLEMQTFGVRHRFVSRIGDLIGVEAGARRRTTVLRGALSPVYTTLAYGALILALGIAALVGVGELTSLGAVMLVMMRSLSNGQQLQVASGSLMASLPFLEHLDTTLERYETDRATSGEVQLTQLGSIVAEHASFYYQADRPVLHDISFRIEPGEVVGVIGPSGAGKSTLVQLLLGLRNPTEGTISVCDADLRTVNRGSWAQRVAFVAQDAQLITGTVAENIRFFRDGIDDASLRRASKEANIAADIDKLPGGFDAHLGERGSQLSGGQRQRLSIARALAARPELLILDEPTSALDVNSEALIRATVSELKGSVTVIIIAHRMSTLEVCDRIMVIEAGRMMAFGNPQALREGNDFYRIALELSGMT